MRVRMLAEQLALESQTPGVGLDREVTGGYASDLLSCVMAKARKGNVWVTLQCHANVIAVAALLELAGVIITEGARPDAEMLKKAVEQGVPVLTTPLTTFTTVTKLAALGVQGVDAAGEG